MTFFSQLSFLGRHLVVDLFFPALMMQLALCIYQRVCHGRGRRIWLDGALLLLLLLLCAYASAASEGARLLEVPWLLFPAALLAEAVHTVLGIRREYRIHRGTLTGDSIRQTLDNLNSGILFADASGRAVLQNHRMANTFFAWQGRYPQTLQELEAALGTAPQVSDRPVLHRLPDGRVWRFRTQPLHAPDLPGFTQTTAQEMTELFSANEQLAAENDALRAAIAGMREMLDRVEERVREEETLRIKMRIHNDIGRSLISLAALMEHPAQSPAEARSDEERSSSELDILRQAVRLFSTAAPEPPLSLEEVVRESAELGVTVTLSGDPPAHPAAEGLAAAALRECVTNCVRHAGGSRVSVAFAHRPEGCTATFTNDGAPPAGPIREGGGLSSLRALVEGAGGRMALAHAPAFALTLTLNEKELSL